jgi:hypothetical protein
MKRGVSNNGLVSRLSSSLLLVCASRHGFILFTRSVQPRILTEDGELSRRIVEQKLLPIAVLHQEQRSAGCVSAHLAGALAARPLGPVLPWERGGHAQINFWSTER